MLFFVTVLADFGIGRRAGRRRSRGLKLASTAAQYWKTGAAKGTMAASKFSVANITEAGNER